MSSNKCPACGVRLTTSVHIAKPKAETDRSRVNYYEAAKMRDSGKTLDEIGARFEVTGEAVRQILARGPGKLEYRGTTTVCTNANEGRLK